MSTTTSMLILCTTNFWMMNRAVALSLLSTSSLGFKFIGSYSLNPFSMTPQLCWWATDVEFHEKFPISKMHLTWVWVRVQDCLYEAQGWFEGQKNTVGDSGVYTHNIFPLGRFISHSTNLCFSSTGIPLRIGLNLLGSDINQSGRSRWWGVVFGFKSTRHRTRLYFLEDG